MQWLSASASLGFLGSARCLLGLSYGHLKAAPGQTAEVMPHVSVLWELGGSWPLEHLHVASPRGLGSLGVAVGSQRKCLQTVFQETQAETLRLLTL